MAYLPGFDYDLFVSYAHGPGQGDGKADLLSAWTVQLANDLRYHINVQLGIKDPSSSFKIWIDPEIRANHPLTETIKDTIKRSGLFLAVMSHYYLKSPWCLDEVSWFAGQPERSAASNRIFVARAFHTDHSEWPVALKDSAGNAQPGIRLHSLADGPGDIGRPYGFPLPQPGDRDYQDRVIQLAREIAEQARSLKAAPPVQEARPEGPLSGSRIFLGCVHDTLDEQRGEVRQALEALGATVHPPAEDELGDAESVHEAMAKYLAQCNVLVLLANEFGGGKWPRGQEGGFISLQIEAARNNGVPVCLWLQMDDVSRLRNESQAAYFAKLMAQAENNSLRVRLQHSSVGDFVRYVREQMVEPAPADVGVAKTAVLCSNLTTNDVLYTRLEASVHAALRAKGMLFRAQRHQRENDARMVSDLKESIRNADSVLILCFDKNYDWVVNLLRQFVTFGAGPRDRKSKMIIVGPQADEHDIIDATSLAYKTLYAVNLDEASLKSRIGELL